MSAFQASGIFIAVICKQFGAVGLKDIYIKASLIVIGSVERVLKGKQYNKGVRALIIIYEALQRLNLKTFERWLRKVNKEDALVDYLESTEILQLINNTKKTSFDAAIDSCECTFDLFLHFDQSICSKFGSMFVFWKSFIKITQISLNYIKSTCTGDWSLHLQASERMLVWFFCI